MYVYQITLELDGNSFYPRSLINKLSNELCVKSACNPNEIYIFAGKERKADFGTMTLKHHHNICLMNEDLTSYEEKYIIFLDNNYELLIQAGMENIDIRYEVFFTGDICNMNIFNKSILKKIAKYDVSLLLSTYCMTKHKMMDLFNLPEKQFEA
jgi:hypothetical protein